MPAETETIVNSQFLIGLMRGRMPDDGQFKALQGTGDRWHRALSEMTSGYSVDVEKLLSVQFEDVPSDQMILLRDVPFVSLCEHHLFPFSGTATVAYIPADAQVVGLSKLARLVEAHARRLQVQERMTHDICDDIQRYLQPRGAACIVRGRHSCMSCRGIRKDAEMITSSLRGMFKDDDNVRAELLALARP